MKAVILAGGLGTRLAEETQVRPKPMVDIGGRPILWHIMKIYSAHGINDFIVCLGYKGYVIKEYFSNYALHTSDVSFDFNRSSVELRQNSAEPWRVTLVDTGDNTMTGGRLKRVADYLSGESDFCFTYGDGLADIDISESISFHRKSGNLATVSAVSPPGRFGALTISNNKVVTFDEKPVGDGRLINGGFFVLSPGVLDLIADDSSVWETSVMNQLVARQELGAFKHDGFWHPMDTLRDKSYLEELWHSGKAPWKAWD